MTNLGSPTTPLSMTGEQDVLEVRTSDPTSPDPDERWIRSDIAPETDQIATMRCGDGTDIPIFSTGTATDTVRECRRVRVGGQTGYMPIAPPADASFTERRFRHNGTTMAYHDAVSPGPAIPDAAVAHYDATRLAATDGDAITTWTDELGNYDATGGSPVYTASAINGNAALDFTHADGDFFEASTASFSQPTTIFAVVSAGFGNTISEYRTVVGNTDASGNNLGWRGNSDTWGMYSTSHSDLEGSNDTSVNLLTGVFDGSNAVLRENGSQTATGDTTGASQSTIRIGDEGNATNWGGYIGEIVWCDGLVSGADLDAEEQRLADKWGITL